MFYQTQTARSPPKSPPGSDGMEHVRCLPVVMAANSAFLSLVTLTFDLWHWHSISTERGTKHVFPVNLAQIRSAVPDIFDSETNKKHKCVSRLARRIPHHTALSNAAARNSQCLPTVVTIDDNRTNRQFNSGLFIHDDQQHRRSTPGRRLMPPPPWLPASQSSPKGEKTCPDSRLTRVQNFTPLAFSAAEKSVTVQTKKNKQKHSKLSTPPYYRIVG